MSFNLQFSIFLTTKHGFGNKPRMSLRRFEEMIRDRIGEERWLKVSKSWIVSATDKQRFYDRVNWMMFNAFEESEYSHGETFATHYEKVLTFHFENEEDLIWFQMKYL